MRNKKNVCEDGDEFFETAAFGWKVLSSGDESIGRFIGGFKSHTQYDKICNMMIVCV